jgi:hypothetical protein
VDQPATGGGTTAGTLSAFYRIAESGDSAPTLADPGDHLTAVIVGWSGVDTTTPFDDSAQFVASGNTAAISCPSVTTTVDECRIVAMAAISRDQATTNAFSWNANSHLSDTAELYDQGSSQGNGGSLGIFHGVKDAAGVVDAVTGSVVAGNNWWPYALTLAIRPSVSPGALIGSAAGSATGAGVLSLSVPLAGSATGTATASALLVRSPLSLSGASAAGASASASLSVQRALTGTSAGTAVLDAHLSFDAVNLRVTQLVVKGAIPTGANLPGPQDLQGTSAGSAITEGFLRVDVALSGSSAGSSTGEAIFADSVRLFGTAAGSATGTGTLNTLLPSLRVTQVVVKFGGIGIPPKLLLTQLAVKVAYAVNANIVIDVDLAGSAAGTSTAEGHLNYVGLEGLAAWSPEDPTLGDIGVLTLQIALTGSSAGAATGVGRLGPGDQPLTGLAAGSSTAVGTMGGLLGLAGLAAGSSGGTGYLTGDLSLKGSAAGSGFCQGALLALRQGGWPGGYPPSTLPPERHVYIRYRGIDITPLVMYDGTRFVTSARGTPGVCTIRIRDKLHDLDFITGGSITLDIGTTRHWGGFLATAKRGFFFDGTTQSPENAVRYIELRGVDYNIFFQKRVLFDKVLPTNVKLTTFPPDTPDDEIIKYYAIHHLDLAGDGIDTETLVENVGTPSQDEEISGSAGWSWGQFLRHIRFHTGAIDYIDPDKKLVHTDVDTPSAAYGISDAPIAGEIGCRELEIDFDAAKMRNDALVWGAGQGVANVVFSRETNSASIAEHGLWQVGQFLPQVWRQATVDRIADSWVLGSPQNKRGGKDDRVAARMVVFEPVFRVAQKVNLRSAVWDFEDVIPIREMVIDFPTPYNPRFTLTLSHEIDDPWSTFEFWIPDFEIPEIPDIQIKLPPIPVYVDPDGNNIPVADPWVCTDGEVVYDQATIPALFNEGVITVAMKYSRGNYPTSLPTITDHPSGNDYYLIDGNEETGREGYRLGPKGDSIIWSSQVPLVVSAISIDQGMAGFSDEPGRHRGVWGRVYVGTLSNGSNKVAVAEWGEELPSIRGVTPNREDPNGGAATIIAEFGPYLEVKWVEFQLLQGYWFDGTGLYDFGGRWRVSRASLWAACQTGPAPGPDGTVRGGDGVVIIGPPPPEGEDPNAHYIYLSSSWIPGTLMVWVDGILQQPGVDYQESSSGRWIQFPEEWEGGDLFVRYVPI